VAAIALPHHASHPRRNLTEYTDYAALERRGEHRDRRQRQWCPALCYPREVPPELFDRCVLLAQFPYDGDHVETVQAQHVGYPVTLLVVRE
jgi:hypothetical protein